MTSPRVERLDNAVHHGGFRGCDPGMLLWHTTRDRNSAKWIIDYLNSTKEPKSYHYLIDRDGTIYRHTRVELVAYHAGDSAWPNPITGDGTETCKPNGGHTLNAIALGIAWANADGETLTAQQTTSGLWLANVHIRQFNIPLELNLGHLEVSPGRKIDPSAAAFSMDEWRQKIADYMQPAAA